MLQQSNHPTALMFHVGFKLAALIVYMFGGLFSKSFVVSFVMVVLLLAFDFWTVKNVSGRLLVGLRWWNEVREDGTNEWRFESREDTSRISDLDSRVFWLTLWVMPLIWGIFTVSTFFSFNYGWMLCCLVRVRRSSCAASFPRCSLPRNAPACCGVSLRVTAAPMASAPFGAALTLAWGIRLGRVSNSPLCGVFTTLRGMGSRCTRACRCRLKIRIAHRCRVPSTPACRWPYSSRGQTCMATQSAAALPKSGWEASRPRLRRRCSRSNSPASRGPTLNQVEATRVCRLLVPTTFNVSCLWISYAAVGARLAARGPPPPELCFV